MPTVRDTRKANLRLAVRQAGSAADLARALAHYKPHKTTETYQSYISQILGKNAQRAPGSDFCRDVEHVINRPEGWMDVPHSEKAAEVIPLHDALTDTGIHRARVIGNIDPAIKEAIDEMLRRIDKLTPPKKPRKKHKR